MVFVSVSIILDDFNWISGTTYYERNEQQCEQRSHEGFLRVKEYCLMVSGDYCRLVGEPWAVSPILLHRQPKPRSGTPAFEDPVSVHAAADLAE